MKRETVLITPLRKFGDSYGLDRFPISSISKTVEFYERQAIQRRMYLCVGIEVDTRNCNQSK
jgi:hypothetical protein